MTNSALLASSRPTRRHVLKSAALGSVAAIAAPYVRDSYAAGSLALGVWDHWVPGANNTLTKLCNEWGAKNNCAGHDRLHHLAGRKGQADGRRRSASRHRSRHHVASRLEHPHSPERARAARRRRRAAHQAIRPDQPGRRISCPHQRHLARRADGGGQPSQAVLLALRSLSEIYRHRRARHVPGRRVEMGSSEDRNVELGYLSRLRSKTLQSRFPRRLADGPDQRRRRLGRRAVTIPSAWSWSTPRTTSRSTPPRPAPPWNTSRS